MDSFAKFLKFVSLSDEIMGFIRVLDCWKRAVTRLHGVLSKHRLGTDALFQEVRGSLAHRFAPKLGHSRTPQLLVGRRVLEHPCQCRLDHSLLYWIDPNEEIVAWVVNGVGCYRRFCVTRQF